MERIILILAGLFLVAIFQTKLLAQQEQKQTQSQQVQQEQKQYEPCDPANPNYSIECRDESKRDFAKCGEVDYRGINLVESDRLGPVFPPVGHPDYDPFLEKIIFSVNINTVRGKNQKFEIFVYDKEGQKRLTWNANSSNANICPFWTKDRNIVYGEAIRKNENNEAINYRYMLIDRNGKKIKEVDGLEYERLYQESHQGEYPDVISVKP